jgi:uncharacterized integral membrane protein
MRHINAIVWIGIGIAVTGLLLENSTTVTVKIIQDVAFEIPLSLALVGAMGLGAFLVLISTVWSEIRQFRLNRQELDAKTQKIRDLEQTLEQALEKTIAPSHPKISA